MPSSHDDSPPPGGADHRFLDRASVIQAGRLAALGELAVGVSHEIKNPLMMMTGLLELALEGLRDGNVDTARADIEQALVASGRITAVLDRLLAFAQGAAAEPEVFALAALIERTQLLLEERLRLGGVDLAIRCPEALWVRGHAQALGQVFLHLLLNAREALEPGGGWVRVIAEESDAHTVAVLFQDSGPGVPVSLRDRIFDPFFSTKGSTSSSGLGLAISQEVVRAHGGSLHYESHPGVGATFRVTLPRHAEVTTSRSPAAG